MKQKRKPIALICLLVLSMLTCIIGYAEEPQESLSVEDGRVSDEGMMSAIEDYLNTKTLSVEALSGMSMLADEESSIVTDIVNRNQSFSDFEERLNVIFENVDITPMVTEILSQSGEVTVLNVYESTVIEYTTSTEECTHDVMGYGTDHVMTLEMINGEYQVVADSFDERFITGACSADVAGTPIVGDVDMDDVLAAVETTGDEVSTMAVTNSTYNVNAAITYAHTYCGVAGTKDYFDFDGVTGGEDTALYNSSYPIYLGVDCANFISQCLYAGGLSQDSIWKVGSWTWMNAKKLHLYLKDQGYATVSAQNYSNVFPGNPVYWWNGVENDTSISPSGHQMICTGYNSAGVPVVDGHNNNMFRVPITGYLNRGNGLYTAQIVSSDQHTHEYPVDYEYTSYGHYKTCRICMVETTAVAHIAAGTGTIRTCKICGYRGIFAASPTAFGLMK